MDYPRIPRPNLTGILISVALGVVVAVGLYQAQVRGLIPQVPQTLPKLQSQEIRTIVQEENAVIAVVEKSSPSVVAIGVLRRVINPFDPFAVPKKEESTIGTGFVVEGKGIIVTNKHVVSESGSYTVITKDGQKYEVRKIYRDPILDLAIVQIDNPNLPPLDLGDSSKIKVGQTVIAIGNALGRFTNTVTTGVVSGLGRRVVAGDPFSGFLESLDNLIQTDAAINLGNSGGPLLNSQGQVVGVNVATTEGAQNIGFAIPITYVKQLVSEFTQKGTISRPFLGIQYRFISKDVAILNEVPQGAFIQQVIEGGPADKAGVKAGDIITKINGQSVSEENKVAEAVSKANIGTQLQLTIWRDGKQLDLTAVIGAAPQQ